MVLVTLSAIAAWSTGQLFTDRPSEGEILKVFVSHKSVGIITMIVMIIGSLFRIWLVMQKKEEISIKWIAFGFYPLGFAAVSVTGYMGGIMVYNFMMAQRKLRCGKYIQVYINRDRNI